MNLNFLYIPKNPIGMCFFALFAFSCQSKTSSLPSDATPAWAVYPQASSLAERAVGSASSFNAQPSSIPIVQKANPPALALDQRSALAACIAQYQAGDYGKALSLIRELWASLEPQQPGPILQHLSNKAVREAGLIFALIELKTHNYKQGIVLLEKLIAANSEWEPPYLALGEHYLSSQAPGLAVKVAALGVQRFFDKSSEMYLLLARAHRALQDRTSARQVLNQAAALFPQNNDVTLWEATLDFDEGFLTDACEKFSRVYERQSELPEAANNFALCLTHRGQWDRAENVLKLAIGKNPEVSNLHFMFGTVEKNRGNLLAAQKAWQDFLILASPTDPNRVFVQSALADLKQKNLETGTSEPQKVE